MDLYMPTSSKSIRYVHEIQQHLPIVDLYGQLLGKPHVCIFCVFRANLSGHGALYGEIHIPSSSFSPLLYYPPHLFPDLFTSLSSSSFPLNEIMNMLQQDHLGSHDPHYHSLINEPSE